MCPRKLEGYSQGFLKRKSLVEQRQGPRQLQPTCFFNKPFKCQERMHVLMRRYLFFATFRRIWTQPVSSQAAVIILPKTTTIRYFIVTVSFLGIFYCFYQSVHQHLIEQRFHPPSNHSKTGAELSSAPVTLVFVRLNASCHVVLVKLVSGQS